MSIERIEILKKIFDVEASHITQIDAFKDLFKVVTIQFGEVYIVFKGITSGGGSNSTSRAEDEKRIQINASAANFIALTNSIFGNSKRQHAILLGYTLEENLTLVAFKPKFSTAKPSNPISFQIKQETLDSAKIDGFVKQQRDSIWECVFQKEYINFYLQHHYTIHENSFTPNDPLLTFQDRNSDHIFDNRLSKPFLLLAGISGTGKTRFVREQAKATGSLSETYCLTSVRPDWHEPSDLLGYISRLDGEAKYITTDVLQFIAKAWRAIIDANLDIQADHNGRLEVTGEKSDLEKILPYWLCLDEMNLAPVEQYFADYLSILETREWQWSDENQFSYSCDAILKPSIFNQVSDKSQLRADLGLNGSQYDQAWDLFYAYGMSLPLNLIVAGTVNMDETTHGFSRKVIDRALSFDFGDFFPNDFDHFFKPVVSHKALSYPLYSQADPKYFPTIDSDGQKSITFLKSINAILDNTPFKLAFRALNELLLSVISASPNNDVELQAVWDDFLMCKVLPRIDGDHDKLIFIDSNSLDDTSSPSYNTTDQTILNQLSKVLAQNLNQIWDESKGLKQRRHDLYRNNIDGSPIPISCRSKAKLEWMQSRLQRSGFTSFWP